MSWHVDSTKILGKSLPSAPRLYSIPSGRWWTPSTSHQSPALARSTQLHASAVRSAPLRSPFSSSCSFRGSGSGGGTWKATRAQFWRRLRVLGRSRARGSGGTSVGERCLEAKVVPQIVQLIEKVWEHADLQTYVRGSWPYY